MRELMRVFRMPEQREKGTRAKSRKGTEDAKAQRKNESERTKKEPTTIWFSLAIFVSRVTPLP